VDDLTLNLNGKVDIANFKKIITTFNAYFLKLKGILITNMIIYLGDIGQ
jgi:hypothetical protein